MLKTPQLFTSRHILKCVAFSAALLFFSSAPAQQKDTTAIRYSAFITSSDLKKHLSIIASDDFEGRETGKPGQQKAADYIAAQFKLFGIPTLKDGLYFQKFDVYPVNSSKTVITVNNKEYHFLEDFYSYRGTSELITESDKILFLGYGIDEKNYSDYKDVDVKDKVLMILGGEPFRDSINLVTGKPGTTDLSEEPKLKSKLARTKGARALFVVVDDFEADLNKVTFLAEHSPLSLDKPENIPMPVFYLSKKMAEDILSAMKMHKSVKDIKNKISKTGNTLNSLASVKTKIDYRFADATLHSENVLGYVEGSDLKDQLLVVSAHYDHLGVVDGKIFNGADDDGSGTVSVIELAQTFMKAKKEGHGPRRSILFMTVAGEEKGLLGSSYYTDHPVFPLASTVCDLNIDMVGRVDKKHTDSTNYIYVIGSAMLSSGLHKVSENCDRLYCGLRLDYTYDDPNDKNRFYYRSDHYNFAKNNIPVIFYFNGTHADYHKETDEVQKIDFALMEKRVKLVFYTAWTIANMDDRLVVDVQQKK